MTAPQQQLFSLYQKQNVLGVLLFSLVTIVVWVSISLITSQTKSSLSPELQKLARPLTPTLNQDVLDQIETKRHYDEADLQGFPIYKVATPERGGRSSTSPAPAANRTSNLGTLTAAQASPSGETTESIEPALELDQPIGTELDQSSTPTEPSDQASSSESSLE